MTVCTKNRECLFGEIVDDAMVLNDVGKIVEEEWKRGEIVRSYILLDEFVICRIISMELSYLRVGHVGGVPERFLVINN